MCGSNRHTLFPVQCIIGSCILSSYASSVLHSIAMVIVLNFILPPMLAALQFCGYEVQTEGDAFLVAFHEPFDAVAWCLATQLALHSESAGHIIPVSLLYHDFSKVCVQCSMRHATATHDCPSEQRSANCQWQWFRAESMWASRG